VSLEFSYIGFGANLGQPQRTLAQVLREMNSDLGSVRRVSQLYRSTPWGDTPGPDYVNAVIELETSRTAKGLLASLQTIERNSGRETTRRNAPRTCDLDILLRRDEVISDEALTVPHPRLHLRRFVLVPLCDLIPEERHPVLGTSFRKLLNELRDNGEVVPIVSQETVIL
jgi:2-amino-4-hydroxy-6-hydroxymethyldihydropteridine diphosphokinase